ncbi:ComEC family competence protein [Clavibacter michiganensis]|uniref:ComEC family competence protein n=1 Tax=Clavibacter michiganensis TaxID=28447 RepID=A0A251XTS5_9MICO|nr:ComEC family competence protein [Clavibacter michiganensis]
MTPDARRASGTRRPSRGAAPQIDLRLAVPAAVGWVATAAAIGVRGASCPSAVAAAAAALTTGASALALSRLPCIRRRRSRIRLDTGTRTGGDRRVIRVLCAVAVSASVAALLLGAAAAREPSRHPGALEDAVTTDGMVVADVVLDEPPAAMAGGARRPGAGTGRLRLVGRLTTLHVGRERGGAVHDGTVALPVPVPVVVFATGGTHPGLARLGVGTAVRISASVRPAAPADRAAYLLLARGAPETVSPPTGALGPADALRAGLSRAAADLPGPGARLLPGLAIGDVSAVTPELSQTMKDSSLTHLTAVSGANCAVVVGLVLALAAAAGLRRPLRAVAASAALAAFVVLVTPQPSVLRAAVMAAVLIASTASGRPARGLPVLALAVVVLVTADPWLARDVGFALSVLATAGLLVLAPPIAARLGRRMPQRVAGALAIPIAAQIACQPVLLVLQPGLPVHGVVANLLAEPAAAPATVGGLAACVLLPVWPAAGGLLLRLAWLPASWIAAVAAVMSRLPGGRIPWPTGPEGVVALVVATALAIAVAALGSAGADRRPGDVPPGG